MQNKSREKLGNIILSLIVTVAVFVSVRLYTGIEFLTNDDLIMQMIANGLVSGQPDGHLVYSDFLWGGMISSLYRVTTLVDWYSLGQIMCLALGSFLILYKIISKEKSFVLKIVISLLFAPVWVIVIFRHVALLQFTITASFVGAVAIFWTLFIDLEEDTEAWIKDIVIVLALVTISFNIREKSFLMMVPIAFTSWIAKWITCEKKNKFIAKRMILFLVFVLGVIGINKGVNSLYYQGEDWDKYLTFNSWTEEVIDYGGFIDYEENKQMYESVNISYEDYDAMANHFCQLLEEDINSESLAAIYNATKVDYSFWDSCRFFINRNLDYTDRPINIIVYAAWISIVVLSVYKIINEKDKRPFIEATCLFVGRMGLWAYLIFKGRFPDRITQSLYIAELLILLAIFIRYNTNKWLVIGSSLLIGILAIYLGMSKAKAVKGECLSRGYYSTSFDELLQYASDNYDNIYFVDANSLANVSRVKKVPDKAGLAFLGGWLPKSPIEQKLLTKKGISNPENHLELLNADNVFYVFRDSEVTTEEYLINYYQQYTNIKCDEIDYLQTDCGINFRIIRIYED